jgi:DNA mismatch repair protein MutL
VWGQAGLVPGAAPSDQTFAWTEVKGTQDDQRFADFFTRKSIAQPQLGVAPEQPSSALSAASTDAPQLPEPSRSSMLQVHNAYVITQDEQGVVIIDQHALHERAMFEYLSRRVLAGPLESQQLLMPVVVPATQELIARASASRELCSRIGLEVTQVGPASLGVSAFPTFLFERGVDPLMFVDELLHALEAVDRKVDTEEALRDVLDMMACKAAIKAGDKLAPQELAELIDLRQHVERSSNCPHGRPTSIRLTLSELARLFGRA